MLFVIAQSTMPEPAGPLTIPNVPSVDETVDYLINLGNSDYGIILAMVLFACGLVYMLQGWKIFKILVVANAAVLGGLIGAHVGTFLRGQNTCLYTGIGGALLLAVLAGPLMRYAVSLMGGLAGSFLGYGLWHYVIETVGADDLARYAWVGALIGLITLGLLAFVILKAVVTILTSIQGGMMTVAGILTIVLKYPAVRESLEMPLRQNRHLAALLVGIPAVIGVAFQYAGIAKKAKKKSGGSGGGG